MPALMITGTLGDQTMHLRCTDSDLEGPEPVTNWILETLGEQPYTLEAMRTLAPRLERLFGATLQIVDVEEEPRPQPVPEERGAPSEPVPDPPAEPTPEEDPAHAIP